jgi:hypothetical protein
MNGYQLTRRWFNFSFEKTEAKAQHTAIYCWLVELNNRLGWKDEFTINTQFTMEGLSIGNKNTYLAALADLENWGFIKTLRPSINQNYGRVITLRCGDLVTAGTTPVPTPLDIALIQESDDNGNSNVPIDKQVNQETTKPLNHETQVAEKKERRQFSAPTFEQVEAYFIEQGASLDCLERCYFYYADANWTNRDGKKVVDWKRTIKNNWILKNRNSEKHDYVPPPTAEQGPKPKSRQFHESVTFTSNQ